MIKNVNKNLLLKLKKLGFVFSYCLTCFSGTSGLINISVGKSVKVSDNVRTSIINDNPGFSDSLELDSINRLYKDNNFYINEYDENKNYELIDKNINTSSLKYISVLKIDASCCGDLSFLEDSKNIQFMSIENFNYLSQQNLNFLSGLSNLKKLYIGISTDYLLKNPNYKLDLSKLNNIENIYLFPCSSNYETDITNLLIYDVGKEYYNTSRSNIFDKCMDNNLLKKVKSWSEQFDEMLKKIPISDDISDDEKIMQIVYFVNDYYNYDEKISEYLDTGIKSIDTDNLVSYYNNNLIDPILAENKEGICCNFTAFTNVLCYKAGLESYYISGYCKDIDGNNVGHAWNIVNINDNYYIVDTTILENNMDYIIFSQLERDSKKTNNWYDAVLDEILIELDGTMANYYIDPYSYIDSIVNQNNIKAEEKKIVYYNLDDSKIVVGFEDKERFKNEVKMFVFGFLITSALVDSKDKVKKKNLIEE